MPNDGQLVRALADQIPAHPRILFTAFVLAVLIMAASRAAHHDLAGLDAALGGVLSPTAVWGEYRIHLLTERECARSTISTWRAILFDFWSFCEKQRGRPWHKATKADLAAYLKRPCQSGRRRGEPVGTATAANKTVAVRQFYLTAALQGWCSTDRMLGVRTPKVRAGAPRSLPADVLRTLLLAAADDERLYLICWLCYGDCLRIGEVATLRIEDVYLHDERPRMRVDGKGGKERWLHLHPEVRATLGRYLAGRPGSGPLIGQRRHPDRPCKANTLSKELGAFISEVAGKGSAHWLRHTGAQAALASARGRNLEDVRELLGHASSRTTMVYLRGYSWDVASAVNGIADPLREGGASP